MFRGGVPADQRAEMRAPFQEGDFPGPVKYGYLNVGVVEQGPADLLGPHGLLPPPAPERLRRARRRRSCAVPDDVPPERAVLAGTVETAVNALWDAAPLVGDRVAVVGGGMVGLCVARLLTGIPGVEVTVVDVDPGDAAVAAALGATLRAARRTRPAGATSSSTRARSSAGLQLCARPARAGGHRRSTSAGTATPR